MLLPVSLLHAGLILAAAAPPDSAKLVPPETVLYDAASHGDTATVRRLLAADPRLATVTLRDSITALHGAAIATEPATIHELVAHGASVNLRGGKQRLTPLFLAVLKGNAGVVQALLDHKADPNVGGTLPTEFESIKGAPLHIAAIRGRCDLARMLLEHGATPDAKTSTDATAADYAWKGGHHLLGQLIGVYRRLGIDQARPLGEIIVAIDAHDSVTVDRALRRRPKLVKVRLEDDATLLHLAAETGSQPVCAALLARGADPTARRKSGSFTPTGVAFHSGHMELATFLNGYESAADAKKKRKS